MCRAVVEGGRRCPCTRGDRRRAYQRLRYAARQAATAAVEEHTTATVDDPSSAEPSSLDQRRAETAAAVDEALTALRDADRSGDPDVHEAYLNAVLDHGAVLRDIADQKIERAYAERRLDDASVSAETAAVAEELEQIESEWREAKKRTDTYLTADGTSFVSDDAAAAIDHARNTYATAKQDIYRRALARSKEINEQRAQLAKQVYYEELSRERSFGGPAAAAFVPSNIAKMTRADRAMFTASTALYPDEMVEHANSLGDMLAKRSKARAHYTAGARQRSRRTRSEVFDLNEPCSTAGSGSTTSSTHPRRWPAAAGRSATATAPTTHSCPAQLRTSARWGSWSLSTTKVAASTPPSNTRPPSPKTGESPTRSCTSKAHGNASPQR